MKVKPAFVPAYSFPEWRALHRISPPRDEVEGENPIDLPREGEERSLSSLTREWESHVCPATAPMEEQPLTAALGPPPPVEQQQAMLVAQRVGADPKLPQEQLLGLWLQKLKETVASIVPRQKEVESGINVEQEVGEDSPPRPRVSHTKTSFSFGIGERLLGRERVGLSTSDRF